MIEEILDTGVKIKIAKLFAESGKSLTVSDVSRELKISKSRASECMRELQGHSVLERRDVGRSAIYKLSHNSIGNAVARSVTQEKSMLSEIEKKLIHRVKKLNPVSVALFGSTVKGLKLGSDIDFMIIFDKKIDEDEIYKTVGDMSDSGIHISIMAMGLREFRNKAAHGEEFILNVIANHRLIYGKKLEGLIWSKK